MASKYFPLSYDISVFYLGHEVPCNVNSFWRNPKFLLLGERGTWSRLCWASPCFDFVPSYKEKDNSSQALPFETWECSYISSWLEIPEHEHVKAFSSLWIKSQSTLQITYILQCNYITHILSFKFEHNKPFKYCFEKPLKFMQHYVSYVRHIFMICLS